MAKQYFVSNDGMELIEREWHPTFGESKRFVTYPCPTPFGNHLCGLEVLEGFDFRLQHQWLSTSPTSFKQWKDCTIEQYNLEKYPSEKRIIAVSTPVTEKKEDKGTLVGKISIDEDSGNLKITPSDKLSKEETQEELWEEVLNIYDDTADYDGLNKSQAIQKFLSQFTVTRK